MGSEDLPRAGAEVDFDHHSPAHADDPIGDFLRVRDRCPFAHSAANGGYWIATDPDDITTIAKDPGRFTSAPREGVSSTQIPGKPALYPQSPLQVDPPDFVFYRRLLHPFTSPKAAEEMRPGIRYWCDFFLDRVIETGEMQLTGDYATPIPASVVADWMGLSLDDWPFYADRFNVTQHAEGGSPEATRAIEEVGERVEAELADRRREPREDLMSVIAGATIDGEPIGDDMALGTASLLLAGGITTTAVLVTHAIVHLAGRPEIQRRLLDDDAFMKTATEEYLRFVTPVLSTARRATEDVEVGGCPVSAGERILLAWSAGNRDPERFEAPEEVWLDRSPNPHFGFGAGPHRCLGLNIARELFACMVRTILRRMPDYEVVEVFPSHTRPLDHSFAGVTIRFTAGAPVLGEDEGRRQFRVLAG